MDTETFRGVVLTRPGLVGLLAEDGARLTVFGPTQQHGLELASMLEEARRAGLPHNAVIVDEWPDPDSDWDEWVTVWG
jgi:hypothetical protein